jgi:hypothetical protein
MTTTQLKNLSKQHKIMSWVFALLAVILILLEGSETTVIMTVLFYCMYSLKATMYEIEENRMSVIARIIKDEVEE